MLGIIPAACAFILQYDLTIELIEQQIFYIRDIQPKKPERKLAKNNLKSFFL